MGKPTRPAGRDLRGLTHDGERFKRVITVDGSLPENLYNWDVRFVLNSYFPVNYGVLVVVRIGEFRHVLALSRLLLGLFS